MPNPNATTEIADAGETTPRAKKVKAHVEAVGSGGGTSGTYVWECSEGDFHARKGLREDGSGIIDEEGLEAIAKVEAHIKAEHA